MPYKVFIYILVFLLLSKVLFAQAVLYAPFINNETDTRFEVIGKSGHFYWVHKTKNNNRYQKRKAHATQDKEAVFEIYNAGLTPITEVSYRLPDSVVKEYLIAGTHYFDQLLITASQGKTRIILNRFRPEGTLVSGRVRLIDFPGTMQADAFLLIRSADKAKLLLLGFEPIEGGAPRVHAIVYNQHWQVLSRFVETSQSIAQPFMQYDFTNYPLEHFDNSPVKLADTGDWMMVAPSRRSNAYLLCHYRSTDSTFIQNEIQAVQGPAVQNTALSLDNTKGEAIAGIFIQSSRSGKKLQIAHYLVSEGRFDFDTTYQIHTQTRSRSRETQVFEQDFISIPGKGFMYLKEYGRLYWPADVNKELQERADEHAEKAGNPIPVLINKNDYTRFSSLWQVRSEYERGDLSLFYFPATEDDTCWSGLLNIAQSNELNSSYLSYVCLPLDGKFIFLYNAGLISRYRNSAATILDEKGHLLEEGIVFWKSNYNLDFQKARQIATKELAVPYVRNRFQGFAVIRF